jgi:pyrophosphatase PpaX
MAARPFAVLFDLDGTLVDTIELLLGSYRHAFGEHAGRRPTEAEWVAGIGTPLATQIRPFARDDAELDALVARYRVWQLEHHDRLTRCYDAVLDTVRRLDERGHPMAIVTSKTDTIARRSVAHVGLAPYMRTIVGCDACARAKPDPEPVLLALERLGYASTEAVFVGDSPYDITAGNAAGVVTVAALWGPIPRRELLEAAPSYHLERIGDLPGLLERFERK